MKSPVATQCFVVFFVSAPFSRPPPHSTHSHTAPPLSSPRRAATMAYSLATSYVGDAFLTGFNWFNGDDPSNGFVSYKNTSDAETLGLYEIRDSGTVILRVDHTNEYPLGTGRPSVRLESKVAYDNGLFIGDFAHMPPSSCGLWPAFWMYGPDWPNSGEIDIIEGANRATRNLISAHTSQGCTIPQSGIETLGEAISFDCTSPGNNNNAGCSFVPPETDMNTYGDTFNSAGGGVYAVEWTSEAIKIWHWPRGRIPQDITGKQPSPDTWGPPTALFGTSTCEPDRYFRQMSVVIQTNFCGDYAGPTWGSSGCRTPEFDTCEQYVSSQPEVFSNAFWEVNYIDVYQRSVSIPTTTVEPTTTTTIEITSTLTVTVQPLPPSSSPSLTTSGQGSTTLSLTSGSSSTETSLSQTLSTQNLTSVTATSSSTTQGSASSVSTLGTVSSSQPTATNGPGTDPINIGEYAYLGCFASENGFTTFDFAAAGPNMTPELCVETCTGRPYAAIHNDQCLCATTLDPRSRALADMSQCDIPCPGNPDQSCGGFLDRSVGGFSVTPARLLRRQDRPASDYLVSLYGVVGGGGEIPPPAPPLGEGSHWQGGNGSGGLPGGWTIITVPYVSVCPTDPARLITTEYCITLTLGPCDGGCDRPPVPSMTTITELCEECGPGGESNVTLTIPEDIVGPTAQPSPPPPPPPPPPPAPSRNQEPPIQGPGIDIRPSVPTSTPTGAVQSESSAALSVGVAILLPIAVTVMRLIL